MRTGSVERSTRETTIAVKLSIEGSGQAQITTGIGFFDHMLTAFCLHGGFDLAVNCQGDLAVDGHHTVEDVGIALGQALGQAVGDQRGIARYGSFYLPMDESLARAVVDFSGRPFLVFQGEFASKMVGEFDPALTEEFFRALAFHSGITLHITLLYGSNDHHKIEAIFKAVAHSIRIAVAKNSDHGLLSTKGEVIYAKDSLND